MTAGEWLHVNVPDQRMEPDDEPSEEADEDECTCRRRDCDDCGIGPDDARDYDDD